MNIIINGTPKNLNEAAHLNDVILQFCKQPKNIISEVNGRIVPCSDWNSTPVSEGDSIELVAFVGGG